MGQAIIIGIIIMPLIPIGVEKQHMFWEVVVVGDDVCQIYH